MAEEDSGRVGPEHREGTIMLLIVDAPFQEYCPRRHGATCLLLWIVMSEGHWSLKHDDVTGQAILGSIILKGARREPCRHTYYRTDRLPEYKSPLTLCFEFHPLSSFPNSCYHIRILRA